MITTTPTLAVIGGINVDLVVTGPQLPGPGETVVGGTFAQHVGGKGGNQAVAAVRALRADGDYLGRVAMVGSVGTDLFGASATAALRDEGVDTRHVNVVDGSSTGVALICVDEAGQNQISVAPGANSQLDPARVIDALVSCDPFLVLASLEVPLSSVLEAATWCRELSIPLILNPAPASADARDPAALAAYVTPNEGERLTLGELPDTATVIETRGALGARIHATPVVDVAAPKVDVVDTTGAGDCFNGVLAAGLLRGLALDDAVRQAVIAAALSVSQAGAREGMPRLPRIELASG